MKYEDDAVWMADIAEALGAVRSCDLLTRERVVELILDLRADRDYWKLRAERAEHIGPERGPAKDNTGLDV